MRVSVELDIPTIGRPLTLDVTAKDMDDTMLDLLGNVRKAHVITAASWAFHLEVIAVVLIEALQAFDEQEVDGEPCIDSEHSSFIVNEEPHLQMGPRQFEFPPNIPDMESPGQ